MEEGVQEPRGRGGRQRLGDAARGHSPLALEEVDVRGVVGSEGVERPEREAHARGHADTRGAGRDPHARVGRCRMAVERLGAELPEERRVASSGFRRNPSRSSRRSWSLDILREQVGAPRRARSRCAAPTSQYRPIALCPAA